jgi:S-adenosylmethionine-dependent methyltransferase
MSIKQDRNFDRLIHRFDRIVYDSNKGNWRLRLLKEDLQFLYESPAPLDVWDAGCGFGQISLWLARQRHRLVLCDVSKQMLARAKGQFQDSGLSAEFHHVSAQMLALELPPFDLVLFHAVLEWLAEPLLTLAIVAAKVKPGGYLSLMFYNRNAVVFKNALRGGWRMQQLLDDSYMGKGNRLTPPNPQYPGEVIAHLEQLGFVVVQHTGIRVFHDYLPDDNLPSEEISQLFDLEARYCRMPTFRDMGRYIHVLAKRTTESPA